jgi:restriction system protein
MRYLIIAAGVLFAIGFVCYLVLTILGHITEAIKDSLKQIRVSWAERRAKNQQAKLDAYREANPARIFDIPNADAFKRVFKILDDFTAAANSFRPQLNGSLDGSFKHHKFPSHLFELRRPHPDSLVQVEPVKFSITAEDLLMSHGFQIAQLYQTATTPPLFSYEKPDLKLDTSSAPTFPAVEKPQRKVVRLILRDDTEVEASSDYLRRVYETQLNKVASLNAQAKTLYEVFDQKYAAATEAFDLMQVYLGNLKLQLKDVQAALTLEFQKARSTFEQECEETIQPLRDTLKLYKDRTPQGIKNHFTLALRNLALPIPSNYQWDVFYDGTERLIQVNQCVPSLADITVRRSDSNRPPAKRDAEAALRRYIPAVALQLAHMVAINDLKNDVDTIAINCWSRFFEPSSGRLKDAFVAALTVKKEEIESMNLQKADALEAFRALRGAFVYSLQDVVPIEPLIRLDKNDDRFVTGRDVLDGMAQGQNLAAMDWQDFEHLIRELLSKEYASGNSEVKITRASRDRGVDAVVFNSDPLHGGKFVVQAKRYTNTVDVAAVRELYGTVLNEGANRGILVTTSHYGRDAYEWAANKPLTLIDGPNLLSLLSKHGYRFRIENLRP